jgi:hypothetical protein
MIDYSIQIHEPVAGARAAFHARSFPRLYMVPFAVAERRDRTDVILCVFPRISSDTTGDQYNAYSRTKVLLHHPFRNL